MPVAPTRNASRWNEPRISSDTRGLVVVTRVSISETPSDSWVEPGPSCSRMTTLLNPLFGELTTIRSVLKTVASTVKKSTWLVQIVESGPMPSPIAMRFPERVIRR